MNTAVEGAFCCTLVFLIVVCGLASIKWRRTRVRRWPRVPKSEISFRANPSTTAGGAYAAPVEPQHLRRART